MREFSLIRRSRIAILLGNSRCFLGLWGIFKKILSRNSRILYYVIIGLDWGISIWNSRFIVMRSSNQVGDDRKRKAGNFYRDCPVKPDNDTALEILEFLAEFSFIVLFCLLAQLLLAAAKPKGQREFRNSKIPRAEFKIPR